MNITLDTRIVDLTAGQFASFIKETINDGLKDVVTPQEDVYVRSKVELIEKLPKSKGRKMSHKTIDSWISQGVIDGLYGEPRPQEYWFNLTQILKRLTSGELTRKRVASRYSRRR